MDVTIVNGYIILKRYCELVGVANPYTYHDFREKIAHALLDPSTWQRRVIKSPPPPQSNKRNGNNNSPTCTKAPRFSAKSLSPNRGALKKRLDTLLQHMPLPPTSRKVCQLHRWAALEKTRLKTPGGACSGLMHCNACGVNICLHCWEMYHTCEDLTSKIDIILENRRNL